jgi:DNA-binding transcriptional ArsR family regulator
MNLNQSADTTISETTAERVAELFATLADPSRVRMIAALTAGEMHVGALAAAVGISESDAPGADA